MRCLKSTILLLVSCLLVGFSPEQGLAQSLTSDRAVTNSYSNSNSQRFADSPKAIEVAVEGSAVLVEDEPFFAAIIQHNGEPLEFLQSLGFNTIQLNGPATDKQLAEAQRLGLRLVCPPPSFITDRKIPGRYRPVIAWSLGNRLDRNQLQLTRERIIDIADSDPLKRPVYGHVQSQWSAYSHLLGILGVGKPFIGTHLRLADYRRWISQVSSYKIQPVWADIQTQIPQALRRQVLAFTGQEPVIPVSHQQMQFQLYQAMAAGSRGFRFLSRDRLDQQDPETTMRVQSVRWLLGHAQQLSPWIAGGLVQKRADLAGPGSSVFSIQLPTSRLLIIQRATQLEQLSCGELKPSDFDISGVSRSSNERVTKSMNLVLLR